MPTLTGCAVSLVGGDHTSVELFAPLSKEGDHAFGRWERITADASLGGYRPGFSDPEARFHHAARRHHSFGR
ncbi:MAG: hypothetical protein IPG50_27930 [Myxococcales bacterium]|nr:hypothetical protein [Myxococcales bacterium]